MAVFRVNKTKDFTVMSNYHLKDKDLSLKAKGLLSQMLSLPDSWDYSIEGLVSINKESRGAIQSTLKDLEDGGYLVRERIQNEKGQFEYVYNIFENPQTEKPQTENPYTVNRFTENPQTENPIQLNTDLSITNKSNTKEEKTENKKERKQGETYDSIIADLDEELKSAIYEFIKMRKLMKKPLTNHALELLIKKLQSMSPDINTQIAILEQSITNSWLGVFPLKSDYGNTTKAEKKAQELDNFYQRAKAWAEAD